MRNRYLGVGVGLAYRYYCCMPDTSVDLTQMQATAQQLRDIADTQLAAFLKEQSSLSETYRAEAAVNTLDGAPAGIYQDTVAVVDAGMQDSMTKGRSIKAALHSLADDIEDHVRGVRSDEADASMQFSYGSDI